MFVYFLHKGSTYVGGEVARVHISLQAVANLTNKTKIKDTATDHQNIDIDKAVTQYLYIVSVNTIVQSLYMPVLEV